MDESQSRKLTVALDKKWWLGGHYFPFGAKGLFSGEGALSFREGLLPSFVRLSRYDKDTVDIQWDTGGKVM